MDSTLELRQPTVALATSYFDMMDAAKAAGDMDQGYAVLDTKRPRDNPAAYVRRQVQMELGIDLHPGFVPMDTRWLVHRDRPDLVLGETRIRHTLSPMLELEGGHVGYFIHPAHRGRGLGGVILQLALRVLAARGVSQVLITCDTANEPSRRIIEKAGGQFAGFSTSPRRGVMVNRYWISIPVDR